jgi:hypothetical protein
LLPNTGFFSTYSEFKFAKDTKMKGGISTLLTYKECLSRVTSFMPFKKSGVRKGFPRILPFKWLFSIFLILMWLRSTLSPEGQTQGWMPDEVFCTHTVFICSHFSRSIIAHNMFWSMAEDFTLNIFFVFTESPYHLTSRNNEKHITEPFLKIITRRSNGFMA